MARLRTRAFVHLPTPPFQRLEGPISVSVPRRAAGLSENSNARFTVATSDIKESWIRPGMCWVIDDSDLGEPVWAGFVAPQAIPLFADFIDIELLGPKKAMLEIELAIRLPINATRSFAMKQVMEAAQLRHGGMSPGRIDAGEGAAFPIDVRGETVSDFIDTLHDELGSAEWLERVEPLYDGNELVFYMDFGPIRNPTGITLGKRDLVDGLFVRERVPASLTLLGSSGQGFSQRVAASSATATGTTASEPSQGPLTELTVQIKEKIAERNIGPGAARHITEISERIGENLSGSAREGIGSVALADVARQRHMDHLQRMDEVILTVDMTRTATQGIRLGDVFHLDVPDWGGGLNIPINLDLHVARTEITSENGERPLEGRVVDTVERFSAS